MRFFVLYISFILFSLNLYSQSTIRSNYEIMDSLSDECVKSLIVGISKDRELKLFHLEFIDLVYNGTNILFENKIIKSLPENSLSSKKDSSEPTISFRIEEFSVKYERYDIDQDSLYRIIKISVLSVLDNRKLKNKIDDRSYEFRELVSRDDLEFIERTSHPFAKAPVPERKKSFFENVLQPAIYVSAALITVLILFTVRSN